jgi:hypothetical protein
MYVTLIREIYRNYIFLIRFHGIRASVPTNSSDATVTPITPTELQHRRTGTVHRDGKGDRTSVP